MGKSRVLLLLAGLLAVGCEEHYISEGKDENFDIPDDLPIRLKRFRSGEEGWHNDPKAVADLALKNSRLLNVPWAPEPYRPSQYEVRESPEWGTYVVRGYVYPSGHLMRYRVKVRKYQEIWYVVQISHYKMHTIDEDQAHPLDH